MDATWWAGLAADYETAAASAFGGMNPPKSKWALTLAMAVAQHETQNGLAWPHVSNFGAVQLRRVTPAEQAAINAGTLKTGATFPGTNGGPGGVLHIDTHPVKGGSIPYAVWFVYFGDDRVAGIEYFLKVFWRLSSSAADDVVGDVAACCGHVAEQMYLHGYFEGFDTGKGPVRPAGQRSLPLWPEEQARADSYAGAMVKCVAYFGPLLPQDWRDQFPVVDTNVETADPAAGGGSEPAA